MVKKPHHENLNKLKDKVKDNKYYRSYIKRNPNDFNLIIAVYCKGCGSKIKGLDSWGRLITYSNYREILIQFDDGSKHLTQICRNCIDIKNKDDLEAMYASDLTELEIEDDGRNPKVWDIYLNRKPTQIIEDKEIK